MKDNIISCIKDKNGIYKHFGISEITASLYGSKLSEIIKVKVEISEDQSPVPPKHVPNQADYWAWVDSKGKLSTLIWPQWFLLNMCFPYGLKAEEERGGGKAYRVNILEID